MSEPDTKLTPELLVSAYVQGVFPMDDDGEIRWFSPDPRAILPLDAFHASKTLMQLWRSGRYDIVMDSAFEEVMEACADRSEGTWISAEITRAYTELFRFGLAHSVEAWHKGTLAGGLYGVSLRGAFFGESMFHIKRDASKVALVALVQHLRDRGFALLDLQFMTPHLHGFGAIETPIADYRKQLNAALELDVSWDGDAPDGSA